MVLSKFLLGVIDYQWTFSNIFLKLELTLSILKNAKFHKAFSAGCSFKVSKTLHGNSERAQNFFEAEVVKLKKNLRRNFCSHRNYNFFLRACFLYKKGKRSFLRLLESSTQRTTTSSFTLGNPDDKKKDKLSSNNKEFKNCHYSCR